MKTDVIVRIDCNKKTCGKCEFLDLFGAVASCNLYYDGTDGIFCPTGLKSRGNLKVEAAYRCEQCLKGELKP